MKTAHFSLSPRPRAVLKRWRLLPQDGEVLLDVGDRVQSSTVVARAAAHGNMISVNVAQRLDLQPQEVPAAMLYQVGDAVTAGEPLARTRGLWGWLATTCRSPVTGSVVAISHHTGQVLLAQPGTPLQVSAYLPGIVTEVSPRRGVAVMGWGAVVPGVFGVGGECAGELVLAVRRPESVLEGGMIGAELAGKIVVGGALVTRDALQRASQHGVAGIVAGGIAAADLDAWLGHEITVADTTELSAPLTVMLLGGFGGVPIPRRTFALLLASEGHQACLSGITRVRAGAVRPELIVPLAAPAPGQVMPTPRAAALQVGCRVTIVREPWLGRTGRVGRLPAQPVVMPNEVRCLGAEVDLDGGGTVSVPRANLDVMGDEASEEAP